MPTDPRDEILFKLADLRDSIKTFMRPQVLQALSELLENLGTDENDFVTQYKFWVEKNGPDCRYASYAKQFFLDDYAESVANCINDLYHKWSKYYEKDEK